MKLIAHMVVRNEEGRYLREVLEHTKEMFDMIVVTDDCSTDNTPEICRSYGAEVFQTEENLFVQDESALRTVAWKNLEKFAEKGDWILALDADEMFYPNGDFRRFINSRYGVLGVTFYHMWDEDHYRIDGAWKPTNSMRLFRFKPGGKFRNRKLACGSEPTYVYQMVRAGFYAPMTGFRMKHLGYARDDDKKIKYDRYMKLDNGNFHSRRHIQSIVQEPVLKEWEDDA